MAKRAALTGITGFVAKRIALDPLEAGHRARGIPNAIGTAPTLDNTKAREVPGIDITAPLAAIDRAADAVLAKG